MIHFVIITSFIGTILDACRNDEPPCLNGGSCVGVPVHVVATTGGTGNNENCVFPFTYQTNSYARCVEGNEVAKSTMMFNSFYRNGCKCRRIMSAIITFQKPLCLISTKITAKNIYLGNFSEHLLIF